MACSVNSILPYLSIVAEDRTREAICAKVAQLLREERLRQKISMNSLAEKAGLSRQMVSYVEQQERKPTLDTLLRLSSILGVKIETVIAEARASAGNPK